MPTLPLNSSAALVTLLAAGLALGLTPASAAASAIDDGRRVAALDTVFQAAVEQDELPGTQTVRVWGDTADATALLWIKGAGKEGRAFDYKVWFSDIYVRRP